MRLRRYIPADFTALYAIEEKCFEPPLRFSRRYMKELLGRPGGAAWIAEVDGVMGGFAIAEWAKGQDGVAAYIDTIEVLSQFRCRGLGAALLAHCEQSARGAGADVLWLHVADENAGAIRLYEAHGFDRLGTEEHFYGAGRGALVFRKLLAEQR